MSKLVNLRLDADTIDAIDKRAKDAGYTDRSSWLRAVILAALAAPVTRPRNASVAMPSLPSPLGYPHPRTRR